MICVHQRNVTITEIYALYTHFMDMFNYQYYIFKKNIVVEAYIIVNGIHYK